MTRAAAIKKAKKHAANMNKMAIVAYNDTFEAIHEDYLEEYLDDGWTEIAAYTYDPFTAEGWRKINPENR